MSLALANFNAYHSRTLFILSPGLQLNISKRDPVNLKTDKLCGYLRALSDVTDVESEPLELVEKRLIGLEAKQRNQLNLLSNRLRAVFYCQHDSS